MEISKVFVIIVTYNGKEWYDRCFSSLRTSELAVQALVIDNASSDDTVKYIQTNYPEVHLIVSDSNLGFGQANNKGMRYALDHGVDYVFLLNQDAWIEPDTIKELVAAHKKQPEYGVLSPIHLNALKTAIEKGLIVYLSTTRHTPNELISDFYLGLKKDIYDTNYVNAAAWMLPRKTLETVGGFDPLFYHYGEDDNYLSRVFYHGFKVGIVPKVTICHDTERRVNATPKASMTFDKWLLQRSSDLLYADNHIDKMIREYVENAIIKLLNFHWSTFKENYFNASFLIKNKKQIMKSRTMNKKNGETWL
jgi:N-acetylglucosaminyl-diphospho-decaprenol L-rhamnosyltransferase